MKIKLIIGVMLAVFLTGLFIAAGKVCALEPIKLGTVLPSNDLTGTESIKAMKLAIKQINASGGLLGRQVELVWADDEMKLDKAAPGLEKLVNVDKVDILIGGMASGSFTAMMPLMKKYQKVTVWNGVSSYKVEEAMAGQDWFFHIYPWDYQIWNNANVGWQQILQKHAGLKIKKVFMAYEDSPYGMGYFAGAKASAESFGYELRGGTFVTGARGGLDYRPVLKQARDFKPDLFVWVGYEKDCVPIMEQSKEIGFNPPMFCGWPPAWPVDMASHPLSEGVTFYTMWGQEMKNVNKASKAFCDTYYKEYKEPPTSFLAPFAYTNVMIVAEAIKRAGTLEKAALIKALEATDYLSPVGDRFTFRKSKYINHQAAAQPKFFQYQKGKIEIIWPWEFATKKLVYPFPPKGDGNIAVADESATAKNVKKAKAKK